MAFQNEYSAQDDCVVLIGVTALNNVYNFNIDPSPERNVRTNSAFGGHHKYRSVGPVTVTLQLDLYDEEGITASLKAYRVNDTTGLDQTITIRPQGTGAGLPELILNPGAGHYGMDLVGHPHSGEAGEDYPLVQGSMTWEGTFDEEPAWTAQSA